MLDHEKNNWNFNILMEIIARSRDRFNTHGNKYLKMNYRNLGSFVRRMYNKSHASSQQNCQQSLRLSTSNSYKHQILYANNKYLYRKHLQ